MICIHCKNDFDESMFYRDKSKPSGRKPRCKKCEMLSVDKKRRAAYEKNIGQKGWRIGGRSSE